LPLLVRATASATPDDPGQAVVSAAGHAEGTLAGRLISASGRGSIEGITIWFAFLPCRGDPVTLEARSDPRGNFEFGLPRDAVCSAKVGAVLEGVDPVDLEPMGEPLEPGDLTLVVNDLVPSHLRFGY